MKRFRIRLTKFSAVAAMTAIVAFGLSQSGHSGIASANGTVTFVAAAPDTPNTPDMANIPQAFSYQGTLRLADGSLANGSYNITLRIYTTVTGGSAIHTESFTNTVARNGAFSVVVGDATPISATVFDNANLYLGITVAPDAEMLPRQRLFPVPWSMQAAQAANATNADTAQVANSLAPNATGNGLTLNRGALNAPGISLVSTSPGWGSGIQFANNAGNVTWGIYAGSDGHFHLDNAGGNQAEMTFENGGDIVAHRKLRTQNIAASGDINSTGSVVANGAVIASGNILAYGKVYATFGFNGYCRGSGPIDVRCDQDVAETFATDERIEAGNVVVFIPEDRAVSSVKVSSRPYEGPIVGVVSTNPGLVFDQGETHLAGPNDHFITDKKTVVAMIGRVPVKFSLENGPIAIGDPLTSGSIPGTAMKATQAGKIIGYAMESSALAKGGKVLVWLQLGTYIPQNTLDALNALVANK